MEHKEHILIWSDGVFCGVTTYDLDLWRAVSAPSLAISGRDPQAALAKLTFLTVNAGAGSNESLRSPVTVRTTMPADAAVSPPGWFPLAVFPTSVIRLALAISSQMSRPSGLSHTSLRSYWIN